MGGCKEDGDRFLSVMLSDRTRGKGYRLIHRTFNLNVKKKIYSESGETREQVVQRGCEVFILGEASSSLEILKTQPDLIHSVILCSF